MYRIEKLFDDEWLVASEHLTPEDRDELYEKFKLTGWPEEKMRKVDDAPLALEEPLSE